MSPYQPTVVATYGGWELVEGLSGRVLRRRRRGLAKPHLLLGAVAICAAAWMNLSGELPDRAAMIVIGFGVLVILSGMRFGSRAAKELRFGAGELLWAVPGEAGGSRWPHSELSHIEIVAQQENLPPAMARRAKPRYRVTIRSDRSALPASFLLFDPQAATALAGCIADETGLEVRTRNTRSD